MPLLTEIWALLKPFFRGKICSPDYLESRQSEFQVPVLKGTFLKRKYFSPVRFRYSQFHCMILLFV